MFLNTTDRAESTLASAITATATSLTVPTGEGAKFPASNFILTLERPTDTAHFERVLCTTRTAETFTIVRAQDGTTARPFVVGDRVELRITSRIIRELQERKQNRERSVLIRNSDYTLTDADDIIMIDALNVPITLTLPSAVGISGRTYELKRIDNSDNMVRVIGSGGQTIDRETHMDILFQNTSFGVVSNGVNWQII